MAQCRSQVYSEMSFDRCLRLCNPHSFKDTDYFCHSRKFPLAASWLLPVPANPLPQPQDTTVLTSVMINYNLDTFESNRGCCC